MRLLASALAISIFLPLLAAAERVHWVDLQREISKPTADFIERAVKEASAASSEALVIRLDTPGGTVAATKQIVSTILNAPLPVVVFVGPKGAFAASAGTFITLAGHVAAMAPGTSIGAAHPVYRGQPPLPGTPPQEGQDDQKQPEPATRNIMDEKIENMMAAFIESIAAERDRNVEWAIDAVRNSVAVTHKRALELGVIDFVVEDLDDLLSAIDGRRVEVGRNTRELATRGATLVQIEMEPLERFYAFITLPQVAFLLMVGGLLGLYIEFNQPGLIIPGALGLLSLILAGLAFQVLPFDTLGLLLLLAGIGLMIAEMFVASFGMLFLAGVLAMAVGGYLLFDVPELTDVAVPFTQVVLPTVLVFAGFGALVVWGVARSFARPQASGSEAMLGATAVADSALAPKGRVFYHGEYWNAEASEPIAVGERVRITEVRDLLLQVSPLREEGEL